MKNKIFSLVLGALVGAVFSLVLLGSSPSLAQGVVAYFDTVNRALFLSAGSNILTLGTASNADALLVSNGTTLLTVNGDPTPTNRKVDIARIGTWNVAAAVTAPLTVDLTPIPGITPPSISITVPATITPADLSGQLNALGAAVRLLETRLITAKIINPTPTPTP